MYAWVLSLYDVGMYILCTLYIPTSYRDKTNAAAGDPFLLLLLNGHVEFVKFFWHHLNGLSMLSTVEFIPRWLILYQQLNFFNQNVMNEEVLEDKFHAHIIQYYYCMTKHFSFLGKGLTEVPGFDLPPVEDLLWGQTVSGNPFPFQVFINSSVEFLTFQMWRDNNKIYFVQF